MQISAVVEPPFKIFAISYYHNSIPNSIPFSVADFLSGITAWLLKIAQACFLDLLYLTFCSVFKWNALRDSVTELYPFLPFCSHPSPAARHHGLIFIQIMFSSSVYTYVSANVSYLQTATSHCFVLACKAFDFLFTSQNFLSVICSHHVHLSPCCFVLPSPLCLPMGAVNRSSPRRQHNAGRVYFCVERLCL